jgi:steroid delta-isomerase-like uncharacterized protein
MSVEENKTLLRSSIEEILNRGNLDALDEFYAVDFVDHAAIPGTPPGIEGMRQTYNMILSAFNNIHVTIDDMIAEGDKVVLRVTATGTHAGEFMGIPSTGKSISIMEIRIYRIVSGKIVEHWGLLDQTAMMQQLGVVPPMDQS